jgi:magnesium transporter
MTTSLALCRAFLDAQPTDAARFIERLPPAEAATLLAELPPAVSAIALDRMTPSAAAACLAGMSPAAAAPLVGALRIDLAAALLRRVAAAEQAALLEGLPPDTAGVLRTLLRHPEGTAGALLDPQAVTVAADVTAADATAQLRRSPQHMLYYVYVVDRAGRLVGVVDVPELLLARPRDLMDGIMHRQVACLRAEVGPSAILAHPGWRRYHALPVVDRDQRLLGAVRYQTFRRLEDEARNRSHGTDAVATAFALGELYWLGLSGLLDAVASAVKPSVQRNPRALEGPDHA